MSDDVEGVEVDVQERQLRLLGAGTVAAGLLVVGVGRVLAEPYDPLVGILGFLGIAAMVFEYTEDAQRGVSLGFLASGVLVWLYPIVVPASGASTTFVGIILVFAGLFNIAFTSLVAGLQDRLPGAGPDEEAD